MPHAPTDLVVRYVQRHGAGPAAVVALGAQLVPRIGIHRDPDQTIGRDRVPDVATTLQGEGEGVRGKITLRKCVCAKAMRSA